jgi:BASS family bile acid:Na+ symporter
MMEVLQLLLEVSLVVFMVGNLLDMGLRLNLREAMKAMRDGRFVIYSVLWGFVLCPALAWSLVRVIPIAPSDGIGLVLLGMAPCAPFLPPMVERARGDLSYAAAFMLLASLITVVYMPVAVPLLVTGFTADAYTIAKPLVLFLLVPLAIGLAIQTRAGLAADRFQRFVKRATGVDTILMLLLCVVVYGKAFVGMVGSYAIGTQILFFSIATVGPLFLSFGLPERQKSVLVLGMATRNIGAALAPLFAVPDTDRRAIVMVSFGVLMQAAFALLAATWFGRHTIREGDAPANALTVDT